jgi:hypothetical protein
VFADPLFEDPSADDFRLQPESPALAMGFQPIATAAAVSRSPVSLEEALRPDPLPVRRFLYNSDGSNILMASDSLTPGVAYGRIDPLVGTGITTFLHCVNPGQNMGYPSRVAPMYHWDSSPAVARSQQELNRKRMSENLARLVADSIDPTALVLDRVRLRGMEVFVTFRMNELHDVDDPESPLLSPFWKDHAEYRVGGYDGWGASALNYAVPQVREYFFALLTEVCDRYDIDGLELDFMRFPYYFPWQPDFMAAYTDTMTQFVGRVRQMTQRVAQQRGRRLLLAARVPTSLQGCAHVGLDPARWCADGLIDFLTVAPFLSTVTEIPVRSLKELCGSVPVYTGMEYTVGRRQMTREEKRAAAALLYAGGTDGLYLFNYFVAWDMGQEADMEVLRDMSDPDSLTGKDKLYTMAIPRYPVPNVSLGSPLPLVLEPGETGAVVMRTHEPVRPRAATLRIEADAELDPAVMTVAVNGTTLPPGKRPEHPMSFPQTVEYPPPDVRHTVEFDVDPTLLSDACEFTFRTRAAVRIEWIYLAVRHDDTSRGGRR